MTAPAATVHRLERFYENCKLMAKQGISTYFLMASVVLWGVLIGGATYASTVYFPAYLQNLPESSVVVNGPYGLNEAVFWMGLHPTLILSLILSLVLNWKNRSRRYLIAVPFAIYLLIIVITSLYFIPELIAFAGSPDSGLSNAEWALRTGRWKTFNFIRLAVLVVSMFPLLVALTRPAVSTQQVDA